MPCVPFQNILFSAYAALWTMLSFTFACTPKPTNKTNDSGSLESTSATSAESLLLDSGGGLGGNKSTQQTGNPAPSQGQALQRSAPPSLPTPQTVAVAMGCVHSGMVTFVSSFESVFGALQTAHSIKNPEERWSESRLGALRSLRIPTTSDTSSEGTLADEQGANSASPRSDAHQGAGQEPSERERCLKLGAFWAHLAFVTFAAQEVEQASCSKVSAARVAQFASRIRCEAPEFAEKFSAWNVQLAPACGAAQRASCEETAKGLFSAEKDCEKVPIESFAKDACAFFDPSAQK